MDFIHSIDLVQSAKKKTKQFYFCDLKCERVLWIQEKKEKELVQRLNNSYRHMKQYAF